MNKDGESMSIRVIGAAVVAGVAVFGLAGCGGSGSDDGGPATTTAEAPSSPSATPKPTTTTPNVTTPTAVANDAAAVEACKTFAAHSETEMKDYKVSTEVYVATVAAKDQRVHTAAKDLTTAGQDIRDGDFTGNWAKIYGAMKSACEPYSAK